MVRDKGLRLFMMVIFGAGGLTILIQAWAQPMASHERFITILIGSIGILWVIVQALSFIHVFKRGDINHH